MSFRAFLVLLVLVGLTVSARAQERPIPYPVIPTPAFDRAVENGTRTRTGEPGPNYWTNTASYQIRATLSPSTNMLRGEETVEYYNASPDTLRRLMVHLRQNLNAEGSIRNRPQQITGGVHVSDVEVGGEVLIERPSFREPGYMIRGTVMIVNLPEPLPPGGSATLAASWSFQVPGLGAPRMGQDGEVYYLGYWYPQIAVYDDINGWTADQYQGNGEFYMDYGSYDVHLTVPQGWLVAATGILQKPEEVLTQQTRDRLAEAAASHDVVHVVAADDRGAGKATMEHPSATLTWHFKADDVRDFAFGTSDHYLWDATTANVGDRDGDGQDDVALINAFYRPDTGAWDQSAKFAQFSIEFLSRFIMPYPYPHMTTVEGIIGGGMEYPMMTLIGGRRASPQSLFGVTLHELGHMWFPMVVGQNEKRYTWMDEGLTSFDTAMGQGEYREGDPWEGYGNRYYGIAGTSIEVEPMRHADNYPYGTPARTIASYTKPALTLHALDGILGHDTFMQAYRTYARRWAYKHPSPYDFFNTFASVSGEDLDWLWTSLLFQTWKMDQAVAGVDQREDGVVVHVEDRGLVPMPVTVRATYDDGHTADETIPVDVWLSGKTATEVTFAPGNVQKVELDPDGYLPDADRSNNTWQGH